MNFLRLRTQRKLSGHLMTKFDTLTTMEVIHGDIHHLGMDRKEETAYLFYTVRLARAKLPAEAGNFT